MLSTSPEVKQHMAITRYACLVFTSAIKCCRTRDRTLSLELVGSSAGFWAASLSGVVEISDRVGEWLEVVVSGLIGSGFIGLAGLPIQGSFLSRVFSPLMYWQKKQKTRKLLA